MGDPVTTNYGWTKPTVGGDGDAWGDLINADLDGIDSTVKSVSTAIPAAASTPPLMDGPAAVGTGATFARADHVHPSDTSLYPASNPSGYQTAAAVTAALVPYALATGVPAASTTTPAMDATAAVGAGTTYARADHVHPSDTSRLALTGGTMAGPLTLATDPAAALQAATRQYVDGGRLGDNRIINGDMRIDQRNAGAAGTAIGVYTVDRWLYGTPQASKGTWGRATAGPGLLILGFGYCLSFTSSSAYAALATDHFEFRQPIEADMIADFAWGTANAQPVTLSFLAQSSLAGTFGGSINNYTGTRSYPFTYSLPAANTWTKIVVTIPGDTGGTWVLQGNGGGLIVYFDLGCGANYRGPGNTWASANYIGATGSVSVVGTNAATFNLTGVKLEIGSVATPFNRQSLAKSLADCQRYYQSGQVAWAGTISSAANAYATAYFPATMRAAPTMMIAVNNCLNFGTLSWAAGAQLATLVGTAPTAGGISINANYTASAEL